MVAAQQCVQRAPATRVQYLVWITAFEDEVLEVVEVGRVEGAFGVQARQGHRRRTGQRGRWVGRLLRGAHAVLDQIAEGPVYTNKTIKILNISIMNYIKRKKMSVCVTTLSS